MNNGIQPTVELATNNGAYPYPVYPYANNGNDGFFGGEGIWAIILLALLFNGGMFGGFGGFGGGFGGMFEFPWLMNGQQEIMNNTNNGFDTLHLSNQVEGVRDSLGNIATQICGSTADIVSAVNTSAYNAEISANNRQMANMQQAFNSEINTLNGFNNINNALQNCCCENRLASCQTQNIVQNEGNQTRFADANNTRDIITNATSNTQAILDKLCQLELDGFKRENEQLRSQLQYANMQASQVQQTADLRANNAVVANQLVSELRSCPIPAVAVYGNTPVFNCPNNNGCGCGFNTTSQFI
jgi:hypothetical protein